MGAPPSEPSSSAATEKASGKRRVRISRACDECRARKTKCDGRQPCGTCEAFERHCSYHLNLGRLGTVQRSKILEDRLRRAHAHIKELQKQLPQSVHVDPDALFGFPPDVQREESEEKEDESDDSQGLEYFTDGQGQMDPPGGKSPATFYGCESGFAFLAKTSAFFSKDTPADAGQEDDDEEEEEEEEDEDEGEKEGSGKSSLTALFDSPLPSKQALDVTGPIAHLLPRRETARNLTRVIFDEAYPLYQFMSIETFEQKTNRIYSLEPFDFNDDDHAFLPLFYAVVAIGMLFSQSEHRKHGCEKSTYQAMRHFIAARHMLDITRCHDLPSIQTLICFVLFLMSTARIATAHTYVGLAVTSAMKIGLHCSHVENDSFSVRERSMRRRVFWTIVKLDQYTSSILGLPPLTDPTKLDMTSEEVVRIVIDESRDTKNGFPEEKLPMMASSKHLQLMKITSKMTHILYVRSHATSSKSDKSPRLTISNAKVEALANELKEWRDSTTKLLQEEFNDKSMARTIQYDLDIADSFATIVLCRPFLHYLAYNAKDDATHQSKLHWAHMCIHAAEKAIERSVDALKQGYLAPASWHAMYTIFMALVSLIFFLATRTDAPERQHIHDVAVDGIRILSTTVCRETGSEKCLKVLHILTKRLSHRMDLNVDQIKADIIPFCKEGDVASQGRVVARKSAARKRSVEPQPTSSQNTVTFSSHNHMPPLQTQNGLVDFGQLHSYPATISNLHLGQPVTESFSLDAMHMPFAQTFNWPYDQDLSAQTSEGATTSQSDSSMPSSHYPLSFDDIDAFMFNNL